AEARLLPLADVRSRAGRRLRELPPLSEEHRPGTTGPGGSDRRRSCRRRARSLGARPWLREDRAESRRPLTCFFPTWWFAAAACSPCRAPVPLRFTSATAALSASSRSTTCRQAVRQTRPPTP